MSTDTRPPLCDTAILALERQALDRWGQGDPGGYLDIYADEITYFDPVAERRLDGLAAMRALYAPLIGKIRVDAFDMLHTRIQRYGSVAVLTYNLVSHLSPSAEERRTVRWNSTAVYADVGGEWRMIHSHWSFTKPDLRIPMSESA